MFVDSFIHSSIYLFIHSFYHSPLDKVTSSFPKHASTHPLWADGPFLPQVQQLGPQVVWAGTGSGSGPARDRGGGGAPYREVMVSSGIVPGVVHTLSVAAGCTEGQQPLIACVGVVCGRIELNMIMMVMTATCRLCGRGLRVFDETAT